MVLIVLTEADPIAAIKSIIRRCAYVLIPLSIVLIKYFPLGRTFAPWGGSDFVGVATSKNMLGGLCLVCSLFFFWNVHTMLLKKEASFDKRELLVNILFLSMIAWLLIKANSSTAFGLLIIGIGMFAGLSIVRQVRYLGVYVFSVVAVLLILQLSFNMIEISVRSLGRDMTLTGRTDLWKELVNMGTDPLLGTGYEGFWLGNRLERVWSKHWWQPNQAHNGYLETYLNLGLIGLFLLAGVIVSAYKKAWKTFRYDLDFARFRMIFLTIALLYNTTETAFKGISIVWFIFLLIAMEVSGLSQGRFQTTGGSRRFPGSLTIWYSISPRYRRLTGQ